MTNDKSSEGIYFDGHSPLEHPVQVLWLPNAIRIERGGAEPMDWSWSDVRKEWIASELYVSNSRSLEYIIVSGLDESNLTALGFQNQSRSTSRKASLALALLVAMLSIVTGIYCGLRPLSYGIARAIPSDKERLIFDSITPIRVLENSRCPNQEARLILEKLGRRIAAEEEAKGPLSFELIDWDIPNAFAFPGRRIYITRAALERLDSSEELLGIMSHELAHIQLRHNLGETIHSLISAFAWSVLVGDFSGAFAIDPKLAKDLSDSAYSREAEGDADRLGAELMATHNFNPLALGEALEKISRVDEDADDEASTPWKISGFLKEALDAIAGAFASHPETNDRIARLRNAYPNASSQEGLSEKEWEFLKNSCKAD